jgi:hypothetical protein
LFVGDELRHGLLLGRIPGGIARDRERHGAAQPSGFIDGRRTPACKARADLDGENAVIR